MIAVPVADDALYVVSPAKAALTCTWPAGSLARDGARRDPERVRRRGAAAACRASASRVLPLTGVKPETRAPASVTVLPLRTGATGASMIVVGFELAATTVNVAVAGARRVGGVAGERRRDGIAAGGLVERDRARGVAARVGRGCGVHDCEPTADRDRLPGDRVACGVDEVRLERRGRADAACVSPVYVVVVAIAVTMNAPESLLAGVRRVAGERGRDRVAEQGRGL